MISPAGGTEAGAGGGLCDASLEPGSPQDDLALCL